MVLVDTSVWVDHLRRGDAALAELLDHGDVACHPFVIGELACGRIGNRREILSLLSKLPSLAKAGDDEALVLIERRGLMGRGLGLVDVHLLASCILADVPLWTRDRKLAAVAEELKLHTG